MPVLFSRAERSGDRHGAAVRRRLLAEPQRAVNQRADVDAQTGDAGVFSPNGVDARIVLLRREALPISTGMTVSGVGSPA